ncbi:MAG: hypothetical protein R2764_12915 [Bacteroidales bacterium]
MINSYGMYTYDYTIDSSQVYGEKASYKELVYEMGNPVGDINGDGLIDMTDKTIWRSEAGIEGYKCSDINMNAQVDNKDLNEVWINNFSYSC